jgi:hypothetical protein
VVYISDDNEQLRQGLEICEFFSLQLDESAVCDASQLLVFIRKFFSDGNIKEDLLKPVPLHGKTRGENIFQSFHTSLLEMNVPIHKFVSITTDGPPTMTTGNVGLIGLCKKIPLTQTF